MISRFKTQPEVRARADYGFARVRDLAFDAVRALWRRRQGDGMSQTDLARTIGRDPAWVSKNLRAPGNWTLRTFGELVEGLDGDIEIIVHANEDGALRQTNSDAYSGYGEKPSTPRRQPPALEYGRQAPLKTQVDPRLRPPPSGADSARQMVD